MHRRPVTRSEVRRFVAEHHRHAEPPLGYRFAIGLTFGDDAELAAVIVAATPSARALDDGRTLEITRLTTTGTPNAASHLYGAACRAARALGYRRVVTYTLADELGTTPRAAGFRVDAEIPGGRRARAGRTRSHDRLRLFDPPKLDDGPKVRWVRDL